QWISAPAWGAGGRPFKSGRPDFRCAPNSKQLISKFEKISKSKILKQNVFGILKFRYLNLFRV
ncbi:hypothetical protein JXB22_07080, partial [candidate division WOR-3 bacterium]|nr:hypothetical protein [candidate division WOR-3 bacterium]